MDRLIKPHVQIIEFLFIANHKCSHTFTLSNLMHTMPVAISLSLSHPSLFIFSSNNPFSIIPPLSSASFTIHLTNPSRHPPISTPPPTVLVRSSMLPTGKAHQDDLRRLFSKPGPHIFKDASIPITFVGRDVAEFLLSPPAEHLHEFSGPLFCKAIAFCEEVQLTELIRIAAGIGNPSAISALIDAGADVNSGESESLVSAAVKSGNSESVQILIESGCEIDNARDRFLHTAAANNRVDLMEILCLGYADIDLNSVDANGQTALHIASINPQTESLQFLLSIGADPEAVDSDGWTPLHHAALHGRAEAVHLLLSHSTFSKYAINNEGRTPFALAVEHGHSDLYDALHLADLLQKSARLNDTDTIQRCISQGAKVNGRDQNGWTALHRAAYKGHLESVEILISHGARIDAVDDIGYTPLLRAVEAGHVEIAMFLLSNGAKASLKSIKGMVSSCEDDVIHLQCLKNNHSYAYTNPNPN